MATSRLTLFVFTAVVLTGCASAPVPSDQPREIIAAAKQQVEDKYWQRALTLRAQGQLAEALESLKIVDAVNPAATGLQAQMADLSLEITSRKSDHLNSAEWAFNQGDNKTGLAFMLRALALQPNDDDLRQRISARYRLIAESRIADKPEVRDAPLEPGTLGEEPIPETNEVNLDKANDLFEQGLLVIETDPVKARELFLGALKADPTHVGARAYLDLLPDR